MGRRKMQDGVGKERGGAAGSWGEKGRGKMPDGVGKGREKGCHSQQAGS